MFRTSEYEEFVNFVKKLDILSGNVVITSAPTRTLIKVSDKFYLNFSSNNYISLSDRKEIKSAITSAMKIYGLGSGGSRLITGNTQVQIQLEEQISKFKGYESSITFATGYMAALGSIKSLTNPVRYNRGELSKSNRETIIYSDELNHACIIEGIKLSKCECQIYQHLNLNDLRDKLKRDRKKRKFIVTESVFSMDGDIADIPTIVELAKEFDAMLMVDDAHGTGVFGKHGKGIAEYFGIDAKSIDVMMGTFTKAFGGVGGFICSTMSIVEYLKYTANTYIFTAPIPPLIAAGLISSIKVLYSSPELLKQYWSKVDYYKNRLTQAGFNIKNSPSQIVPILIGDENLTIRLSRELFSAGYYVPAIIWPAVTKKEGRLRTTIIFDHQKQQIDQFVDDLTTISKKIGLV